MLATVAFPSVAYEICPPFQETGASFCCLFAVPCAPFFDHFTGTERTGTENHPRTPFALDSDFRMLLNPCKRVTCSYPEAPDSLSLRPSNSTRADIHLSRRQSISLKVWLSAPPVSLVCRQRLLAPTQRLVRWLTGLPFETPRPSEFNPLPEGVVPTARIPIPRLRRDPSIARISALRTKTVSGSPFSKYCNSHRVHRFTEQPDAATKLSNHSALEPVKRKAKTQPRHAFYPPRVCSNAAEAGRLSIPACPAPLGYLSSPKDGRYFSHLSVFWNTYSLID